MRTIRISADVFAAIWKRQQGGEVDENVILARILGVATTKTRPREERQFDKSRYQRIYMRGRRAAKRGAPKDSNEDAYVRGYQSVGRGKKTKRFEKSARGSDAPAAHAGRVS